MRKCIDCNNTGKVTITEEDDCYTIDCLNCAVNAFFDGEIDQPELVERMKQKRR